LNLDEFLPSYFPPLDLSYVDGTNPVKEAIFPNSRFFIKRIKEYKLLKQIL